MKTLLKQWKEDIQKAPDGDYGKGQIVQAQLCIDGYQSAVTPRKPRAEWFKLHSAWLVKDPALNEWFVLRSVKKVSGVGFIAFTNGRVFGTILSDLEEVLPIAEEGPPVPVGWGVVE